MQDRDEQITNSLFVIVATKGFIGAGASVYMKFDVIVLLWHEQEQLPPFKILENSY